MILGKSDLSTDTYDVLIFVRRDATDVKIPSFVRHIDYSCFDGCSRIETLTFGHDSELRSIRKLAFANSSIKKLTIPSKFETFEEGWCEDSTKLNEIIISKENPNFITDENHFVLGKSSDAKESTVFDILYFAPRKINKVCIPSFVKHLNSYAFDQCLNIESFEFEENSELVSIGIYCFFECNFTKISFPSSLQIIKSYAFSGSSIEKVDFGENSELTTIEKFAFEETNINKILFPASLKSIGDSSFSSELDEVQFQKNSKLESIGRNCFYRCPITHISIPSSINFIDNRAFGDCGLLVIAEILDDEKEKIVNLYSDSFIGTSEDFVLFVSPYIKLVISNVDKLLEDYD